MQISPNSFKMAGFERAKQHFPLQKIDDVVDLFRDQLKNSDGIDLSLLSIIIGTIENSLTINRSATTNRESELNLQPIFPIIEWETIEALYTKFVTHIKSTVDLSQYPDKYASRELVKKLSDVIWGGLTRAFYKDRAHLQSLYSFLTGKGNEDKRGQPINEAVSEKRWLYLNGHPVVCDLEMEVAAMVSAINPFITVSIDSVEMGSLQQELLWLLYDMGHLAKYPMALGNLADLEEICETPGRPPPVSLFNEGVESAVHFYDNQHIYPYTYLAGHLYRMGKYREALESWAKASDVVKNYNYNREDEEIYKEFIEIANDWLPNVMKVVSNDNASRLRRSTLLHDTESYMNFLRFYDGICQWEEDSATPVLHTVWAKQFVYSLGKFDSRVRKCIHIHAQGEVDESSSENDSSEDENDVNCDVNGNGIVKEDNEKVSVRGSKKRKRCKSGKALENGNGTETVVNGGNEEEKIKHTIEELVSKVGGSDSQRETPPNPNIAALAQACGESILNPDYLLTGGEPFTSGTTTSTPSSTSERVNVDLNEFLSSKSNSTPFVGMTVDSMLKAESPADMMMFRKPPDSAPSEDHQTPEPTDQNTNSEVDAITSGGSLDHDGDKMADDNKLGDSFAVVTPEPVDLLLHSQKMKGVRKLLSSAKLNSSAITLQLTAQSQTDFGRNKRTGLEVEVSHTRKRKRREIF
ncbi:MEN1-like protein [Mya arenaria]|uniref:Menin n=1 Tax=Mya arenaria TaxID=6604 RepID=A0ABY7FE86_MYAAR|nr:MEN1-like protein [Mya arenaria]